MSTILQAAKKHYRQRLNGELSYIDVPEWPNTDGQPSRIFYRQVSNGKTTEAVMTLVMQNKPIEAAYERLIQCALDEDGKRLFKPVHKKELMRETDSDVVMRIIDAMGFDDIEEDQAVAEAGKS